ncbi:MAG: hypothetical protein KF788_03445 [Piscinibacter sp.]|nr:hypothetical protein [Piscinibacter sp.]
MSRRKEVKQPPKLVWRITADAPLGEYVDPRTAVTKKKTAQDGEVREHGWLGSSLELLGGVRVSEAPMDTLPGDLIDEFFKPTGSPATPEPPKPPKKGG